MEASGPDPAAAFEAGAGESSLRADRARALIDTRTIARTMGKRLEERIEANVTRAYRKTRPKHCERMRGAPLSLFHPAAWGRALSNSFTETACRLWKDLWRLVGAISPRTW